MDLKSLGKVVSPLDVVKAAKADKSIKSEITHDRDGNGQSSMGSGQQEREPMSDEQFERAVQHLRSHKAVKDNQLEVLVKESEGKRLVVIQEASGKVIRRILEAELWSLQEVGDSDRGQLLSKTA